MKPYTLLYAFLALFVFGCSKSDEPTKDDGKIEQSVEADYTLLLNTGGMLTGRLLNGDGETLNVNNEASGFTAIAEPHLISDEGKVLTMYHKTASCGGTITVHDFNNATSKSFDIFADLGACNLTATAIVNGGNSLYVAYKKEISLEITEFWVRLVDISGAETTFTDAQLEFNPVGLAFSNSRLFIMGYDEDVSGEHKLTVLSADTNTEIYKDNLGFDARSIFKNPAGNIIVAYDNLHTTINSETLGEAYTNYGPDSVPNFATSELRHFDSNGKMYYAMLAGLHSTYLQIPAVYDFDKNSAVLYAFENFLTEVQLKFEFEIENTTLVHYDEVNNLLLVGYKKSGEGKKGGLLRINPIPQPKFAGNLDLDGVPYSIYIK